MMTYTDSVRKLLAAMDDSHLSLNMIVRRSSIPRHQVIALLARLIHFHVVRWEYTNQQFLFSLV